MKQLPEYFCIKHVDGPLWESYIGWLNRKYGSGFTGGLLSYYGLFPEGVNYSVIPQGTVLTLAEWNEIVNGWKLPEKWYVKRTPDNYQVINEYFNRTKVSHYSSREGYVYSQDMDQSLAPHTSIHRTFTEITFDQFKQYVLNQSTMVNQSNLNSLWL